MDKPHKALLATGPGGIYCPCCAPPIHDVKRITRRRARAAGKREIREELDNYQGASR